jgi:hypothetical protein
LGDYSLLPRTQALKDDRDRQQAAENLTREGGKEKLPAPPSSNVEVQRVLGEAFCINRLDSIRQLVGNAKLKDFADGADRDIREKDITHFFRRFLRQNVEGDSPYFCVSAAILGRLIHTFKEDYITRAKALNASMELHLHVDEIVDRAKESMSQDATAIRMQTQILLTSSIDYLRMHTLDVKRLLQWLTLV